MNRSQKNYLYMTHGIVDMFDGRRDIWENIPVLASCIERVVMLCEDIDTAAKEQAENSSVGYTAAKVQTRTALENSLFVIASRLKAYAVIENNHVIEAMVNFSRSTLHNMSLAMLLIRARTVVDGCHTHSVKLEEVYMLLPEDVTKLEALIDRTTALNAHRNTVSGQRIETTSRLAGLFVRLRSDLKLLDTLVDGYVTDEEFLTVYFSVRRIHDVRGGHVSKKTDEE